MKSKYYVGCVVFAGLMLSAACSKDENGQGGGGGGEKVKLQFSAVMESVGTATKTTMDGDTSSQARNLLWLPGDQILVSNGTNSVKSVNSVGEISATAKFDAEFPAAGEKYYAYYPYSDSVAFDSGKFEMILPKDQTFCENGVTSGTLPMVARSSDANFSFQNLCGIFVLKLKGNYQVSSVIFYGADSDEHLIPVSGSGTVEMNYSDAPALVMGSSARKWITLDCPQPVTLNPTSATAFHIVLPPATYQYYGVLVKDVNGEYEFYEGENPLVIKRSERSSVEFEDIETKDPVDLSIKGTSNSYIVSKVGRYKFKATKGCSSESVGTPTIAQVLWETFGTSEQPEEGDLVQNAVYSSDGYVIFNTPRKLQNGNAVIAVMDSDSTILWSWHIWVCKDFNPEKTAQKYNNSAGTMMDRNLGATSAEPGDDPSLGLMYQWGRKDPFLGGMDVINSRQAASTGEWPDVSGKITISESISNPMQYVAAGGITDVGNWTTEPSDTLWNSSNGGGKTIYDPCPQGWRVPAGGPKDSSGIWSTAFNYESEWESDTAWHSENRGMDFAKSKYTLGEGLIWYPAAGYDRGQKLGEFPTATRVLLNVGFYGYYWSRTPVASTDKNTAYSLYFGSDASTHKVYVNPVDQEARAFGYSVRCAKEESSAGSMEK